MKNPKLFSGSWMEYARNLDEFMLQINGCRSNEAVLKVFNILFPYDKPLPMGKGDELGLQGFYSDARKDPKEDLNAYHPDRLRENIQEEMDGAVHNAIKSNNVENVNDLAEMEKEMVQLQTANEIALVTLQEKDAKILNLTQALDKMRLENKVNSAKDVSVVALEE